MAPLDIIIVGAGIGGLARNGHRVTVYERATASEIGYAFRITANSDRCLKHLGIDTVAGGAVAANSNRMFNAEGREVLHFRENVPRDQGEAGRGTSVFAFRVMSGVFFFFFLFCRGLGWGRGLIFWGVTVAAVASAVDAGGEGEWGRGEGGG